MTARFEFEVGKPPDFESSLAVAGCRVNSVDGTSVHVRADDSGPFHGFAPCINDASRHGDRIERDKDFFEQGRPVVLPP